MAHGYELGDFSTFVRTAGQELLRTAYLLMLDQSEAEELLREGLTRTYAAWSRLDGPEQAEVYCRTLLAHLAIDGSHRRPRDPSMVPPESEVEADPVTDALHTLPLRSRACLVLSEYAGMPVRDVAAAVGLSERHAAVEIGRANQLLRTTRDLPHVSSA